MAGDPNMNFALWLGQGIAGGRPLTLPAKLAGVEQRASFLVRIDGLLMPGSDPASQVTGLGQRIRFLADASVADMPDAPDPLDRVAIALRLWAGCLSAAKTISDATLSGPNSAADRARLFPSIDGIAQQDALFRAGVEAAPIFKRLRNQPHFLEGVPAKSPVRRYAQDEPLVT